jgi:hypothetical protein
MVVRPRDLTNIDLPTICEDETEGYFTGIETEEFAPPSQTARKFILFTFIILLTAKSKPVRIDSRWYSGLESY